jgi:hypothetical protein
MKRFFLLCTCILLIFLTNAQIAYYGAMKISKNTIIRSGNTFHFNPDSVSVLAACLKAYLPDNLKNDPTFTEGRVLDIYRTNPFFGEQIVSFLSGGASTDPSQIFRNAVSSIGGIEIPNQILLGVTDWIVKRTKQELNVFFFDNFRKYIDKYPDLRTVFPQTYNVLRTLGDEIYNYERYLKTLRAAFQSDIDVLDKNLPTIITNHPDFFDRHPELAALLNSSFYIAGALQDKIHPADILEDYPTEYLDKLNPNWKGSIQVIQLLSGSLRDTASLSSTDSVVWVTPKQVKELVKDRITFKIYLGLLYQQAKVKYDNIHFNTSRGDTTLTGILARVGPSYDSVYIAYSGFITHFAEKTNRINNMIKNHEELKNDSGGFKLYYDYYIATIDLLQHCTEISRLPFIKERIPNLPDLLKDYFDVARTTADLTLNVKRHNYSSAVANAIHIYDMVKAKKAEEEVAAPTGLVQAVVDTAKAIKEAKGMLLRYGAFIAAMAEANSSEEVTQALESYALPSGSSRIKRESSFNISLNAYPGLFIGHEMVRGVDEYKPFKKFNSYGVTAPIGVSISWGHSYLPWPFNELVPRSTAGWSSTWYISLVDLGAVAAYRFRDDTTAQVPTVQLKNLFSPGVIWSLGIPRSPISVNLGMQVGPNLRKIDNNNVTLASEDNGNKTYLRFSVAICVDIPVFNFYTKSR